MTLEHGSPRTRLDTPLIVRLYPWHALAYGVSMGALTVINIYVGGGWWSFWPMIAWGLLLALHFFYYKAVTVDEDWARERTDDLRLRSYDLSHIQDIQDRVEQHDASVRPGDERDPKS